jgi:adenine-specific DNA-methyltransferase
MAKRRTRKQVEVKTTTHPDKRVNIPTQELSDFMTDEQRRLRPVLYPRDPSLDPQLVWKGKDEQDSQPLEVLSKPIYVQEKVHPIAIIENIKAEAKRHSPAPTQLSLFADFNGIEWEDQVDFYRHEQNWANRMILGDSLQVMCSLAEREGLRGQVQMIYIDPPYGIKFSSNWQVSTRERSVKDSKAGLTRQPEQVKAFRDTWELGIHSYLAYLRDRLAVARELLTETGSIFVQIGDENVHLVRCLLDEVFGSKNFCGLITFQTTTGQSSTLLPSTADHLIWYAYDKLSVKYRTLYWQKGKTEVAGNDWVELSNWTFRRPLAEERDSSLLPENVRVFRSDNLTSDGVSHGTTVNFEYQGRTFHPGKNHWKTTPDGLRQLDKANRLLVVGNTLCYKRYRDDFPVSPISEIWDDTRVSTFASQKIYVVQTNTKVIERCLLMTTGPGDLVLDPTCGSGATAYVAEQWGRRWITIDTSRVSLTLARTRLMSSRYAYYQLADPQGKDIKQGFQYRTVPHIMLRDIAKNREIDDIHARWQEKLKPIRDRLNTVLKQNWQEWEVPQEAEKAWPLEAQRLFEEWWQLRRQRQAEIDESIARNSDQETLYDQPYEENHVVRVTGPFTVESLSPYKPISPAVAAAQPAAEREGQAQGNVGKFEQQIIENLRQSGVQNTKQGERLVFDILESADGGIYIQAEGEYTDSSGQVKQVAVCIGPEHGTVGKDLIKGAATEAVRGLGADMLLVCGFSFDAEVSEETKRYGRLTVLPVRMNPDLTMASLLKKTDKANLFMIFGEPDLTVSKRDGKLTIKLRGLDIYDPTTGEIRSSSTTDIACWFIDTNYDGNSFFVRHAYFTGAGEPYDQLKRALRAEINQEAWKALYRTESLPFEPPETGQIAVKVINHYGDEVLKVYQL